MFTLIASHSWRIFGKKALQFTFDYKLKNLDI